ncbi:MAG: redoxin domain-containing protein [candidate division Zixibacteria bacterium]|nr:redoxin domain-containing protein [candidate division Zixibacteria bacterium]
MRVKQSLIGLLLIAVLIPGSWFAGQYAAAAWQRHKEKKAYDERLSVLNLNNDEFRVGGAFPDVALLSVADSSVTSVYREIRNGGLILYFSANCSGCEKELAAIQSAITEIEHPKDVILISPDSWSSLRAWRDTQQMSLPVFVDVNGQIRAMHEFVIIPALALLDPQMIVIQNSVGGGSAEDYRAILE